MSKDMDVKAFVLLALDCFQYKYMWTRGEWIKDFVIQEPVFSLALIQQLGNEFLLRLNLIIQFICGGISWKCAMAETYIKLPPHACYKMLVAHIKGTLNSRQGCSQQFMES